MHQHRARRAALRGNRVAFAVAAAFLPWGHAYALPTGENVVHGDVTVTRPAAELMQINQGTQKGIVNWQGFSIGASEHVNITQPNAGASLLNRVVGNNPSEIFGRLTANGQVFLVNNAGVLFAPSASVEVGSLVASTLSITDQNFLNNNYQFFNPGNAGSVVNQGSIITANGYTALIGPQVRNDGVILAQSGKVALGAGDRVTLDMVGDGLISISVDEAAFNASVVNTGTLQADGGTVMLKAQSANALLDTVINTSGVIRANALVERNGEIVLDGGGAGVVAVSGTLQAPTIKVVGDKVGLLDGARVDASGNAAGGSVLVNGNAIYVGAGASVSADALQSGDGGQVILWSSDSTQIHGAVSARGAAGGTGGFVETSGGYLEITRAPEVGAGGTWLIDPYNITVVAVAVPPSNNSGAPSFTPTGNDSQVEAAMISGQLTAGTNVVLDTTGDGLGVQPGNITVNAAITKFAPNAASLTFDADNNVTLNASVIMTSGAFNVVAGGNMTVNGSAASAGTMNLNIAGDLSVVANPFAPATVTAQSGQIIAARSIDVRAQGALATISNQASGNQTITASGGSIDVQTLAPGSTAILSNLSTGTQSITVQNGDHLNVKANSGFASIQAGSGTQKISVTGSGANAINIGNPGAGGSSQVVARVQEITAGDKDLAQQGSININGSAVSNSTTGFITVNNLAGNTQTFSTSGTIDVRGGTALNTPPPPPGVATQSNAGIFHNSNGLQKVTAGAINLQGGPSGNNNGAFINSQNGGDQRIEVGGDISIAGGFGNAGFIGAAGRNQTVFGGNISLTNSAAGGINSVGLILGARQDIHATGNVTLTARASGGDLPGVRIGGNGTAPTDLKLFVGDDLVLTAGTAANNGVGIGSTAAVGGLANNIYIEAGGSVILNSGTLSGTGARIGSPAAGTGPGTIEIHANKNGAGGDIQLNGVSQPTTIRTTGTVILEATNITEAANGRVIAGTLLTTTSGNTNLTGPNELATFSGTSAGNLTLNNTGALTVTSVNVAGNATVSNVGDLTLNSPWTSGDAVLSASGAITEIGGGAIVANTLTTTSGGSTTLGGLNQVASYNGESGGELTLNNSGALTITGLNAGGSAAVTNFGNVSLTGAWSSASADIRANGPGATISEAGGGFIQAGSLTTFSEGATSLTGANQVASFNGSTIFDGDISLNNTGSLTITGLSAGGDFTLTNSGAVSVTGLSFSFGAMDIATTAGNLTLTSALSSGRAMTLDVGGTLTLSANGPQTAQLISNSGGQTITAQSVDVRAQNGGFAFVNSIAGGQTITANGGNLDVQVISGGGFAQISSNPGSNQTVRVIDGDHLNVNGASGFAGIFSGGTQTLSITGSGDNAITVGSLGARGPSNVGSLSHQNVTAGLSGEQGSITIVGSDAQSALAGFVSNPSAGGTQTISTTGTISITGGRAAPQLGNFPAGIFHNGTGQQTINAARLELRGGPSGSNNAALINVPGGGVPANAGPQLINVSGDIDIAAGPGGNAGILGSGVRQQTIFADNIRITNSAGGGINSVGFILGGHQDIHATGDVTLTARASGGDLPGVRIGGNATNPTDLRLFVGGDLVLTAGTVQNNGVGIGSTASVGGLGNEIYIEAGGSVILNSGTLAGTGARIGSPAAGAGPGNIEIRAGGGIELNGVAQGTAIRTLGTVTLHADHIVEGANGFIIAGTLNTATTGNASLTGPNQVANFSASSAAGDVVLNNTAPLLTVTSITAQGISISQSGALDVVGNVTSTGAQTISATGDITIGADGNAVEVRAGGPITMSSGGNIAVAGGTADGSHALVFSSADINLTVGGFLTLDAGTGRDAWARVQLESRDSVISVFFPNLSSGGYFVNGVEGLLRDGHTGFLAGNGVAAPGHQFITTYGVP